MKYAAITLLLLTVLVTTGCVGKMPQTADEFRQALPGAFMGNLETYEVDRSAAEIGKTFQKYAPKCLDVSLATTSQTSTSYQHIVTQYTPTVVVNQTRSELHLQEKHQQGVVAVYEEPAAGHYLMVVDATPLGPHKAKIEFYRPSMGFETLVTAIKNWTRGKNLGCPDLTK